MVAVMTKVCPLSERHNVITEFGISFRKEYLSLCNPHRYWVMTDITVMTVITLITLLGGILLFNQNQPIGGKGENGFKVHKSKVALAAIDTKWGQRVSTKFGQSADKHRLYTVILRRKSN